MKSIRADELGTYLRGKMGLVVGPGFTINPGIMAELSSHLASEFSVERRDSFLETGDRCLEAGVHENGLHDGIRQFFATQKAAPGLAQLAKARWSAVLSLALDTFLEDKLQREAERRFPRHPITVLDDGRQPAPPRSTPVFKLLGRADRDTFAYTTANYAMRRASWWRSAVKDYADLVKGSPTLCVGMSDCPWALQDLLAEMYAQPTTTPRYILLLAEDPLRENAAFLRLVGSRSVVVTVQSSPGELVSAAEAADKTGYAPQLPFPDENQKSPLDDLHPCEEIAAVVNRQLVSGIRDEERERLLDLLFSPAVPQWGPFEYELDFRRSLETELREEIVRTGSLQQPDYKYAAYAVHGPAASGKTVLLKRLAFDLAKSGDLVLWMRPSSLGESTQTLRYFFESVAKSKAYRNKRVIVFMDDPLRFTSLQPKDVNTAARASEVNTLLILGVRSTDWLTRERDGLIGSLPLFNEYSLSDELDDDEWRRFANYLEKLEVAANQVAAETMMRGVRSKHAQDTLSVLYWLLPQTKSMIVSSVREEFFRLGETAWMPTVVEGAQQQSPQLLKNAYEMVAVADHYRAPLPVEILVSALNVEYREWLDASSKSGPVWGLLYGEDLPDSETTSYRTRNNIVTRILVEAINGGSFGHSGELRVLRKLIGACIGSQPAYRDFCARVLVSNEQLDRLEYEEGLELYDLAIKSLPFPDRTLMHHKGLWIKNKGKDPLLAAKVLEEALKTNIYPYMRRAEIDEHIHTSMAATALDALEAGRMSLADGKAAVLNHLERAKSPKIFNPRAVHVRANLMLRLADKEPTDTADNYHLIAEALAEVDRTLIILNNPLHERRGESETEMLKEVRDQVFVKVGDENKIRERADELWEKHASQQGFVLVARKLFSLATNSNRGKDYKKAYDYCTLTMNRLTNSGQTPSASLCETALHIYYNWRIQRSTFSSSGQTIYWELVKNHSLGALRASSGYEEPFHRYTYALALAHLNEWADARGVFAQLRQLGLPREVTWEPRDYLLNPEGGPRTLQGVMKGGGVQGLFFYAEDLHLDFQAERRDEWPRPDAIAHAHIQFAFGGTTAVMVKPDAARHPKGQTS